MQGRPFGAVVGIALFACVGLLSCAPAPVPTPVLAVDEVDLSVEAEAEEDTEGGAGGGVEAGTGGLTGLPGIDHAQNLEMRILDARGTGRVAGRPIVVGVTTTLPTGEWLLSEADAEYEITLRSTLLPDGIVRLGGRAAFLVEDPTVGPLPRFRLFAGHGSFYLPNLPQGELVVLTPAGPLVTRGAVFTVTVTPDFQVLVTCREGSVYLTGSQNAVAFPGQVVVADRLGRGRVYSMTPNEALVFAQRWWKVMEEESAPVLAATLPRRLVAWQNARAASDAEETRFLALWFREARSILGAPVPGPETWASTLGREVRRSVWTPLPSNPGLLGELP